MPDLKPFVQQDNVIRLSPLTKVVAGNAASAGSQGGAASAGSYNTDAGASYPKGGSTGNPHLDALADAARSGDGNAMSMLEALGWTLGVGGALVAGGAAAYNALKKGKPTSQMDPASVKSAGELPEQARLPKSQEQKLLPAPTKAITDAKGYRPVLYYCKRTGKTDDFYNKVLMACWFYGCTAVWDKKSEDAKRF